MTKEEFKKELEKLRFDELMEKNIEKRKLIHDKIVLLKRQYSHLLAEKMIENRRNLK